MTQVSLRVSEIFFSLQGESTRVGLPTIFIRLTGCPLRCTWCDTEYAFTGGSATTIVEILTETAKHGTRTICVTGGEPLAQKNCLPLLTALCDAGYDVSLETSGALDIGGVDPRVARIMDIKAPGSGECDKNLWTNLPQLRAGDEVKIVIADRADYEWACCTIAAHRLTEICPVLLSPVQGALQPADLANWILADKLPVRFQLQLHKVLWGNMRGK
ncbi:MAG: 7-carboxy-7-deazaguanine synthase QueE [Betaproteobacteria bacterium]|uniref:7-carboxy-7-deazaguanine synthase n=1 Tax=Candidatus Proximibacter danicus TaxID=2954365 RepID=A0A9D7PQ58_9PROT|nr:7-carboxy-7-deazaguanine synthase QueE [Candidatus Proximibacter danicus]